MEHNNNIRLKRYLLFEVSYVKMIEDMPLIVAYIIFSNSVWCKCTHVPKLDWNVDGDFSNNFAYIFHFLLTIKLPYSCSASGYKLGPLDDTTFGVSQGVP